MITLIVLSSKDNLSKEERLNLEIKMCEACTISAALKCCEHCKFNHALKVIEAQKVRYLPMKLYIDGVYVPS